MLLSIGIPAQEKKLQLRHKIIIEASVCRVLQMLGGKTEDSLVQIVFFPFVNAIDLNLFACQRDITFFQLRFTSLGRVSRDCPVLG